VVQGPMGNGQCEDPRAFVAIPMYGTALVADT